MRIKLSLIFCRVGVYSMNLFDMIIYKIENKINGKIYIGQTKKDINKRVIEHIRNDKFYIGRALNKYGIELFAVSIIDIAYDSKTLNKKEKYWIKFHNCIVPNGYNFTEGGGGIRGLRHSEQTKLKIGKSNTGKIRSKKIREKLSIIHKQIPIPKETREKMSETRKGKHLSEETRQKISIALIGKHPSEETRKKISESQRGENNHNYGKHPSDEVRRKISEATRGENNPNYGKCVSEEVRKKMSIAHSGENHPMYGKKHSKESRLKMSKAHKGIHAGENHPMYGKHHTKEVRLKMSMSSKDQIPVNKGKPMAEETKAKLRTVWTIKKQRIAA